MINALIHIVNEKGVVNNCELVKRSIVMYNITVYKNNYMVVDMIWNKNKNLP